MKKLVAVAMVSTFAGCGGGGRPSTPSSPVPMPTPTPGPVEIMITVLSPDVPKDIGNPPTFNSTATTTSTANVTADGTILDLSVTVAISHTWRGDLDVRLRHPDGTTVDLYLGNVRDSGDDVSETFTVANTPLLRVLFGKRAMGVWTLVIDDTQPEDKGTLRSWGLGLQLRTP